MNHDCLRFKIFAFVFVFIFNNKRKNLEKLKINAHFECEFFFDEMNNW